MRPLRLLAAILLVLVTAFAHYARAQGNPSEYRIAPGDTVRVLVYQNPDLTLDARVTETGNITYPLLGIIRIGGMTITGAEQAIAKGLSGGGFINRPQVTISVSTRGGTLVSVLGQVNKPGRYPLETVNMRLSEVLATAGGISSTGADAAIVTGTRDGKPFYREIEIAGMFLDNRLQDDLVIVGGDVIYVHRAPTYYIYGEVNKPGSHRIERGMTLRQALALAGGPSQRGTERRVGLYRRGTGGAVELLSPDLSDAIRPDDVIYVRESLF